MVQVHVKGRVVALAIRKEFAKRIKDRAQMQIDVGKLFIANSVTLAMGVGSDILRAVAQKCSSDREDFFFWASNLNWCSRSSVRSQ